MHSPIWLNDAQHTALIPAWTHHIGTEIVNMCQTSLKLVPSSSKLRAAQYLCSLGMRWIVSRWKWATVLGLYVVIGHALDCLPLKVSYSTWFIRRHWACVGLSPVESELQYLVYTSSLGMRWIVSRWKWATCFIHQLLLDFLLAKHTKYGTMNNMSKYSVYSIHFIMSHFAIFYSLLSCVCSPQDLFLLQKGTPGGPQFYSVSENPCFGKVYQIQVLMTNKISLLHKSNIKYHIYSYILLFSKSVSLLSAKRIIKADINGGGEGGGGRGQKKKKKKKKFFFFFWLAPPPPPSPPAPLKGSPPRPPSDSRFWVAIQHMKQIQYNGTTRKEF